MNEILTGPFQINTWIVPLRENKVFIVDPAACSLTRDEDKIINYLEKNNLEPVGIFLTHGHFDHITGTAILKEKFPKIKLACHKADCSSAGKNAYQTQKLVLEMMGLEEILPALENLPEPDISLNGNEHLDSVFGSENLSAEVNACLSNWKVLHTPGHSEGSSCLYNAKEKTLISGDTVFFHSWGRTDLPGGNEQKLMHSLAKLKETLPPDTKVYPGHDHFGFALGNNF